MGINLRNVIIAITGILVLAIIVFGSRKIYIWTYEYFGISEAELVNGYEVDPIEGFNDAKKFIEYGYPQIKELSIQFLAILTSILVFSVTFSEKIINHNTAKSYSKITIIFGWSFIILAIISDGIGLAFNAFALPFALSDVYTIEHYKINSDYFYIPAFKSLFAILLSGFLFILGLLSIVITGILSVLNR